MKRHYLVFCYGDHRQNDIVEIPAEHSILAQMTAVKLFGNDWHTLYDTRARAEEHIARYREYDDQAARQARAQASEGETNG